MSMLTNGCQAGALAAKGVEKPVLARLKALPIRLPRITDPPGPMPAALLDISLKICRPV
jgi:hypothetical protein